MKNVFYFYLICKIGGIETFYYNLAKKYGKSHDITIYYQQGDPEQIARLSEFVRVRKYTGQHIKCERAFFNFNLEAIDNIEADEYIQIIHGDYKAMGILPKYDPRITRYIGVSQNACDTFRELTGKDIELCYNPTRPLKKKTVKTLKLVSLTRIDRVKGFLRMQRLMDILTSCGIEWHWTVYTDQRLSFDNPRLEYRQPTLDIELALSEADYVVQLSDAEGYCYTVVEALQMGVPVIVTDIPVFKELGIVNGVNGFTIGLDMKNVPVDKIVKGLKKFTYDPPEDGWDKLLVPGESDYQEKLKRIVSVMVKQIYFDLILQREVRPGEILAVEHKRAVMLKERGLCEYIDPSDGEDDAL